METKKLTKKGEAVSKQIKLLYMIGGNHSRETIDQAQCSRSKNIEN